MHNLDHNVDLSVFKLHLNSLKRESVTVKTSCPTLNSYLEKFDFSSSVTEFGAPSGGFGRVIPAIIMNSFDRNVLWLTDKEECDLYPSFFNSIGVKLDRFLFVNSKKCLSTFRMAVLENAADLILMDTEAFVSKSDMNSFSSFARKNNCTYMILRPYYITNKNGNPFSKYRFNCFYNLRSDQFKISCLKGFQKKNLFVNRGDLYR